MTDLIETFHFGDTNKKKKKKKNDEKKANNQKQLGHKKRIEAILWNCRQFRLIGKSALKKNKLKEITCNET